MAPATAAANRLAGFPSAGATASVGWWQQEYLTAIGGSAKDRGKNMLVLGLICAVFGLDKDKLVTIVSRQFGKKDESVLRNALLAFDAGYAYQIGDLEKFAFAPGEASAANRISTDGNQNNVVDTFFGRGNSPIASGTIALSSVNVELDGNSAEGALTFATDGRQTLQGTLAALVRVLSDRDLAQSLGAAAHARYADWHSSPAQFARQLRDLLDEMIAAAPG